MADDPNTRAELNRLYWETDASVADIGDRLDISRRALYEGIEPRPAGVPCSECGSPLVYRNRTALDNREAECLDCGHGEELGDQELVEDPEVEQYRHAAALAPVRRVSYEGHGPLLGIALLVGLAAGTLTVYWVRRG
jgi:hypothetical protein